MGLEQSFELTSVLKSLNFAESTVFEIPNEVLETAFNELRSRTERRRSTELILKKGFQFNAKEKLLVIPVGFITGDVTVSEIMLSCAKILGFKVTVYQDDSITYGLSGNADNILLGLLYSIGGPRNTKFTHSKNGRELGYAIGMSLRLKGEATRANVVGALRPNNFFFANNPNEVVVAANKKKIPISYGVKNTLVSIFNSADAGTIFYKVISSTLQFLGFQDIDPKDQLSLFENNIITFDDIIKKNWVEVWTENSKNPQLIQVRKATFPSRNALLLNEELDAIQSYTKPFFSSVEDLRNDYFNLLFRFGYSDFMSMVSKRYNVRHTILQNISSVTTKRLQSLRKILNMQDLKKKQVNRERLLTYLSRIEHPLEAFQEELQKILSASQRQVANSCLAIQHGIPPKFAVDFLLKKVLIAYEKYGIYENKNQVIIQPITADEQAIGLYESLYKKVCSCKRKVDLLRHYMSKVISAETSSYRGFLYKKILSLHDNILESYTGIEKQLEVHGRAVVKLMAFTVEFLESWTSNDLEILRHVSIWIERFAKLYSGTKKTNTLPQSEDQAMLAFIKEEIEAIKALTFSNKPLHH
jgi:hypothetical protein